MRLLRKPMNWMNPHRRWFTDQDTDETVPEKGHSFTAYPHWCSLTCWWDGETEFCRRERAVAVSPV